MAKKQTEGRRGQSARAARKRSPEARAAARAQGLRMHAAYLAWREANPNGPKQAGRRAAETRRENRAAAGIENMRPVTLRLREDQIDFVTARAKACPCPFAELIRHAIDKMIYEVDEDEEAV